MNVPKNSILGQLLSTPEGTKQFLIGSVRVLRERSFVKGPVLPKEGPDAEELDRLLSVPPDQLDWKAIDDIIAKYDVVL